MSAARLLIRSTVVAACAARILHGQTSTTTPPATPGANAAVTPATTPAAPLTLDDAIAVAIQHNPDYLVTLTARRTAEAQRRIARGALLPQVSATFGSQFQKAGAQTIQGVNFNTASDIYQSTYGVGVTYRLSAATFVNPRLQNATVAAADADVRGSRFALRQAVTQQYLAALKARAQAALADSLVAASQTQLTLATAKLRVGEATSLDVARAQVDLGTQRVAALTAHNQVEIQVLRLFQVMGVAPPARVVLTTGFALSEPTFSLPVLIDEAERGNPALAALRFREHAAALGISAARSDYLPSLSLSTGVGGYTYQLANPNGRIAGLRFNAEQQQAQCLSTDSLRRAAGLGSIATQCQQMVFTDAQAAAFRTQNSQFPFNFTSQPFALSAQLSIPLFNGFQREAGVQEAEAQRESARYAAERGTLAITEAVSEAYLALRAAAQTVSLQEETVAQARNELRLAEERFRVGAGSSLDVSTARAAFAQAETAHINAIYDFHTAFAALEGAVGRPIR